MTRKRLSEDETTPIERPKLLADASVTIYMDGLIILLHDDDLTQAAIHTQAEGHSLKIVLLDANGSVLWPPTEQELNDLQDIVANHGAEGIFWLFISPIPQPPQPPHPDDHDAELHTDGERSFDRVLDFESDLYNHKLNNFRRHRVALLNMPHGRFYSASNAETEVCSLSDDQKPRHGKFEKTLTTSSLPAADISGSVAGPDKHLVLLWRKNDGSVQVVFTEPLNGNTPYEVHIYNTPDHSSHGEGADDHFLLYYNLFDRIGNERRLFPTLKPGQVRETPSRENFAGPHSPPCDNTQASQTDPFTS